MIIAKHNVIYVYLFFLIFKLNSLFIVNKAGQLILAELGYRNGIQNTQTHRIEPGKTLESTRDIYSIFAVSGQCLVPTRYDDKGSTFLVVEKDTYTIHDDPPHRSCTML